MRGKYYAVLIEWNYPNSAPAVPLAAGCEFLKKDAMRLAKESAEQELRYFSEKVKKGVKIAQCGDAYLIDGGLGNYYCARVVEVESLKFPS